jgi:hyperosmotically inducible protein
MTLIRYARAVATAIAIGVVLAACGPKDADIKASVDQAISDVQGVTVDVAKGVATISGEFANEAAKAATEAKVKAVKGVKSVVNNATVTPPVVISPDEALKATVATALKDFSTLTADVKDGVVTLTGEIKRDELPRVMQALSALNPKKIENKATVKR